MNEYKISEKFSWKHKSANKSLQQKVYYHIKNKFIARIIAIVVVILYSTIRFFYDIVKYGFKYSIFGIIELLRFISKEIKYLFNKNK